MTMGHAMLCIILLCAPLLAQIEVLKNNSWVTLR
jgi:hypothetical protein